ncbi:hypothetical protein [Actinocorallia sp. A-T 12471]|uniref:hypothetical protein n=1 Tax=Actinocorallia sp. A-T 12471 TaxID=3089813 RepID=UPI0029CD5900|nr:hypothetical protein [Actinocorallia sp. A-T 12471]MDX6743835.1 hypothetical protein [Actinocorallia sp. A-T 12471]
MNDMLWVAVPAGRATPATVQIRVLVVPRLGGGVLEEFGFQDWPSLLANSSFEVRVKDDDGVRTLDAVPGQEPVAASEAWHAFFDGAAGVIEPYTPKVQPTPEVRPTHAQALTVATSYRECAAVLAEKGPDGAADDVRRSIERFLAPAAPAVEVEEPLPPLPPPVDFHRTVAALREHPAVLEALGLIFTLTVDAADLVAARGVRRVSVRCADDPLRDMVTSPWTRYDLAADGFWPAPADPDGGLARGMLDLSGTLMVDFAEAGTPKWAFTTIDVDGAVRALRERADTRDDGRPPALPDLRTDGLTLIRPGRGAEFAARGEVAAARAGESLENAELTAEDLVLGYRVDIRSADRPWRSLCEREATYTVEGADGVTVALGAPGTREEGHVKPFAAVKTPDGALHADEAVLRWDGWSLAVPFLNLLADSPGPSATPGADPPYVFRWDFRPPDGSLPRLRFGKFYQMRIRVADLTGGGPGLADAGADTASEPVRYVRNDPIQPPRLSHDGGSATGAAVDRMVIRSDPGMSAAAFHAANPQYPAVETRTLHPPSASFATIEQHGGFDPGPAGTDPEFAERTWRLAVRALLAEENGDIHGALPDPAAVGVNARLVAAPGGLAEDVQDTSAWAAWPASDPKTVTLTERAGQGPAADARWDASGALAIGLRQGEEVLLELSSTVHEDLLDDFAVKLWLENPSGAAGPVSAAQIERRLAVARAGRHPLLSPVRAILLVHAVRKPLAEPVWQLTADRIFRAENDTNAVLRPLLTALDTDSTGRLEIAAAWREFTDAGETPRAVAYVHGETVARGPVPDLVFRHEFGDTRHRRIAYTVKAISRYRAYFDAADPDTAFQLLRTQETVSVPSSARPPALDVRSVTPSFRWSETVGADRIERVRASRRLRVELAPPWFATGEGEAVAVVLAADGQDPAHPVTRLGRDPVFASPALPAKPSASWFRGFAEPPSASADLGPRTVLVPYAATREGDRWYADVALEPPASVGSSYAPFVRLVLARFQRHSLAGLSLSPLVEADPVRLLPDRRLVVERGGAGVRVSLLGIGPNPPNRLEVVLEEAPVGADPQALTLIDLDGGSGLPAWRPVPGGTVVSDAPETPSTLALPPGTARLRLRVREIERLPAPVPFPAPQELRDSTVFLDTVLIPASWRPA